MGYKKSLSAYLKLKVKEAVKFITHFEKQLEYQAHRRSCKGVICGHIHTPALELEREIHYINSGDWIENNSYILYNEGKFTLRKHK
jgi:UDP-2,3-diacylglucosamine pyrophosphatase LpxH